jgi:hypothetical protein
MANKWKSGVCDVVWTKVMFNYDDSSVAVAAV